MAFALDLAKFQRKVTAQGGNVDKVIRKVVIDLGASLVLKSPVGDAAYWTRPAPPGYVGGHFRHNWQYGAGARPVGVLSGTDADGGATVAAIEGEARAEGASRTVHYLMNNTPYAQRIEHGWSKQAPAGVVGVTVVEFQAIADGAIRGIAALKGAEYAGAGA